MRIAIIGATYTGNRGAAAMLISTVAELRERLSGNVEFNVLSLYREKPSTAVERGVNVEFLPAVKLMILLPMLCILYRLFQWFAPISKLLKQFLPLNILTGADVLLDLSGISFVDGRGVTLVYNVCCLLPALILNTPIFKMSQAMGSFNNETNRFCARHLLSRIHQVFSRGKETTRHLESIGLTNWTESADLAFLLRSSQTDTSSSEITHNESKLVIGVAPSQVLQNYCKKAGIDYISVLNSAIESLESLMEVHLVIIAHSNLGENSQSRNNDYHVCSELHSSSKCRNKSLCSGDLTPEELRDIIAGCDVLIASRFHAMISALCTGVPVLVTSWSHKYREVMDEFQCGEWVLPLEALKQKAFSHKLSLLIENRTAVRSVITSHLPKAKRSAMVQIRYVADYLLGNVK